MTAERFLYVFTNGNKHGPYPVTIDDHGILGDGTPIEDYVMYALLDECIPVEQAYRQWMEWLEKQEARDDN